MNATQAAFKALPPAASGYDSPDFRTESKMV
jgi:hypothetical protein